MTPRNDIATVAAQIGTTLLPDNAAWTNRFEVQSHTSKDRRYVIAQRRTDGVWGCSCTGWRHHRKCKHVTDVLARLARLANSKPAFGPDVLRMLTDARTAYLDLDVKRLHSNVPQQRGREVDL